MQSDNETGSWGFEVPAWEEDNAQGHKAVEYNFDGGECGEDMRFWVGGAGVGKDGDTVWDIGLCISGDGERVGVQWEGRFVECGGAGVRVDSGVCAVQREFKVSDIWEGEEVGV